jgi:hypothetical protein
MYVILPLSRLALLDGKLFDVANFRFTATAEKKSGRT